MSTPGTRERATSLAAGKRPGVLSAWVEGEGGPLGNTPPSNSQPADYVGLDTLEVGFGVEWPENWDRITSSLDQAKKDAADPEASPNLCLMPLGGLLWKVSPKGAAGGVYMAWQLEAEGVRLLLMNRQTPYGETPNLRIILGSLACLGQGSMVNIKAFCRGLVERLGVVVKFEKVSRVDFMQDQGGVAVKEYVDLFRADQFISRAVKMGEYGEFRMGRRATGFTIGADTMMLRIYDKLAELKKDPVKAAAWSGAVWGGKVPGEVTRVEFELKREALKTLEVDTLDDLESKAAAICEYLTTQWMRFVVGGVDRTHTTREEVHALWKRVQEGFRQKLGRVCAAVRHIVRGASDVSALVKQAAGCMLSVAAIRGKRVHMLDDLAGFVVDQLYLLGDGDDGLGDIWRRLTEKVYKFQARTPCVPVVMGAGV